MVAKLVLLTCLVSFAMGKTIFEMTQDWAREGKHTGAEGVHFVEREIERDYHIAERDIEADFHRVDSEAESDHSHSEDASFRTDADEDELDDDYKTIMHILQKDRTPEKYLTGFRLGESNGFNWTSCGGSSDLVTFNQITVEPDELIFPGKVTVSVSGKINADLQAPISMDVQLQKKMGPTWVTIPCAMIGGCHYDDICTLLAAICPPSMPCKCPFKAGPIDVKPTTMPVSEQVPTGDYKMHLSAMNASKQVFCLDLQVAIG